MLADSQFVQSETASIFVNNGISWPTVLAANLPASGPAYPLPAPSLRVRVKPGENVAFQAAVFSGDPSGGNGSNQPAPLPTGTVISFNGGALLIAEASYLSNQDKSTPGLPGTYHIGAWYHTSSHFADQRFDNAGLSLASPQSTGIPLEHAGDYGIYGVVDQTLYRVPGTNDQGLSGFVRAGSVPNDRNLINFYADGGLLYKGLVPGRPDDKIGVAAAYARVGDNARGLDADIGLFGRFFYPVRSGETMIEMMYQAQLANGGPCSLNCSTSSFPAGALSIPMAASGLTHGSSAFARHSSSSSASDALHWLCRAFTTHAPNHAVLQPSASRDSTTACSFTRCRALLRCSKPCRGCGLSDALRPGNYPRCSRKTPGQNTANYAYPVSLDCIT